MAKTIDVTENGSNRRLTIVVANILYAEYLKYNNGQEVTQITLVGDKTIHVNEKTEYVKSLIDAAE